MQMLTRPRDGFFSDFSPLANIISQMLSGQAISLQRKMVDQKNPSWLFCKPHTIPSVFLTFAFHTSTSFLSCLGSLWSQSEGRVRGGRRPVVRQWPIRMTYIPAPNGWAYQLGVRLRRSLQRV